MVDADDACHIHSMHAWAPGVRVDGYRLVDRKGRGGMGEVWLATDLATGADRALKLLDTVADPTMRIRFQREGEALARLGQHPNVVRVHAAGVHEGRPWLAMEWLPGGDLAGRLKHGPLDPAEAARIVRDLARGLEHAHERGVLHRDLKPQNVIFDAEGRPRLGDFGLASLAGASKLTVTGELLGTPAYMAPEQVTGSKIDERTDVYALGAVLYCTLCGVSPTERATVVGTLEAALTGDIVPPRRRRPEVPSELEQVCLAALRTDPATRTPTARALAEGLDACLATPARRQLPGRRQVLRFTAGGASLLLLLGLVVLAWLEPSPVTTARPVDHPVGLSPAATQPPPTSTPRRPTRPWATQTRPREPRPTSPREWRAQELKAQVQRLEAGATAPIDPGLVEAVEGAVREGDPEAQLMLARLLLCQRLDHPRALELLWRASGDPGGSSLARVLLACNLLTESGEEQTARSLLEAAERAGLDPGLERLCAASAWLGLGGPGDLARALGCVRGPCDSAKKYVDPPASVSANLVERLPRMAPAGEALASVLRFEGWVAGSVPDPSLDSMVTIKVARRTSLAWRAASFWLRNAAAVGNAEAGGLLSEPLDPDSLDPMDLLAMEGSRAVRRPVGNEEKRNRLGLTLRNQGGLVPAIRAVALERYEKAEWELAWRLESVDLRRALVWYVLAALHGPDSEGGPFPSAIVAVGRALLLGLGCPADPGRGVFWLERGRTPTTDGRFDRALFEADLWLGLARISGRGLPRDVDAGLRRMKDACEGESARPDANGYLSRRLDQTALVDWWAERTRAALFGTAAEQDAARQDLRQGPPASPVEFDSDDDPPVVPTKGTRWKLVPLMSTRGTGRSAGFSERRIVAWTGAGLASCRRWRTPGLEQATAGESPAHVSFVVPDGDVVYLGRPAGTAPGLVVRRSRQADVLLAGGRLAGFALGSDALAVFDESRVLLVSRATTKIAHEISATRTRCATFTADGTTLLTGGEGAEESGAPPPKSGLLQEWRRAGTGWALAHEHPLLAEVRSLDLHRGKVAMGDAMGVVRELAWPDPVPRSPLGTYSAEASSGAIPLAHAGSLRGCLYIADGSQLITLGQVIQQGENRVEVSVWDVKERTLAQQLSSVPGEVDGTLIGSPGRDQALFATRDEVYLLTPER